MILKAAANATTDARSDRWVIWGPGTIANAPICPTES